MSYNIMIINKKIIDSTSTGSEKKNLKEYNESKMTLIFHDEDALSTVGCIFS